MAEIRLTDSQAAAVNSRGGATLVSAAAGSGKTQVLVERLMSYITDPVSPRDVDSFLVITYTRAAALQLRSKITDRLAAEYSKNPTSSHLRSQTSLVYNAQIGTIHSFCTDLLRENGHLAGISPDFRIMEQQQSDSVKGKILSSLLDDKYERIADDEGFLRLINTVGAGSDDSRLESVVLTLHEKMRSHPYPEKWVQTQLMDLDLKGVTDAGETVWGDYLLRQARDAAAYWTGELRRLADFLETDERLFKAYAPSINETLRAVERFLASAMVGWDAAVSALPVPFTRLGSFKGAAEDEGALLVKSRRTACKKAMESLGRQFFESSQRVVGDLLSASVAMKALLELTLRFDEEYSAEKRRLSLADFPDLEHYAAKLLADPETGEPTQVAQAVSQRYTEIMVDEFQDVNAVQDLIFTAVSLKGRNLFMVGDMKQSIYRFRLADPTIFLGKYKAFAPIGRQGRDEPRLVVMRENFRSRASVLQAANHVFSRLMSEELGEMDYDDNARLIPGNLDYDPREDAPVTLTVYNEPEKGQLHPRLTARDYEAEMTALSIKRLVESEREILDDGVKRPVGYGDIVILLRSPGGSAAYYRAALRRHGIDADLERTGDFFSAPEVSMMVSLLSVVDNPRQDVPLLSVLRSPIFGFTPDELSFIRKSDSLGSFYEALLTAAGGDEKCERFVENLNGLRRLSPYMTAHEFLWHCYVKTDILAIAAAMPDPAARRDNLMQLLEYARRFEQTGYRGLFRFVAWLSRLSQQGGEQSAGAPPQTGCVRIMSIHKSKGLEFPVVYLCDTARQFNKRDARGNVLIHSELGLGPKITDIARGVEYPTIAHRAIAARLIKENLSEELRVLYVAMTRAREVLNVSCVLPSAEKKLEELRLVSGEPIEPQVLLTAPCPAHWLIMAAMTAPKELIEMRLEACSGELGPGAEAAPKRKTQSGEGVEYARQLELLREKLDFVYPYESAALPSKLTATELKGRRGEEEQREEAGRLIENPEPNARFRLPDFAAGDKKLSGAERGTATHRVLERIDLGKTATIAQIEGEIERLRAQGFIDDRQARAVDARAIKEFFASELGGRILSSKNVMREFRFSVLRPATEFFDVQSDDEIMLQGVVDCCFEENGALCIIDYKTDYVTRDTAAERGEYYSGQLRAYASTMLAVTGMPVAQAVIYFLRGGFAVNVPFTDGEIPNNL